MGWPFLSSCQICRPRFTIRQVTIGSHPLHKCRFIRSSIISFGETSELLWHYDHTFRPPRSMTITREPLMIPPQKYIFHTARPLVLLGSSYSICQKTIFVLINLMLSVLCGIGYILILTSLTIKGQKVRNKFASWMTYPGNTLFWIPRYRGMCTPSFYIKNQYGSASWFLVRNTSSWLDCEWPLKFSSDSEDWQNPWTFYGYCFRPMC